MLPAKEGASSKQDDAATEACILLASRQYDVEMVFSVSLRSLGFRSLGDAFTRCRALTRLDVSRNRLVSLEGVAPLADSLQYLNAAENQLKDLTGIDCCTQVEELLLEGNELSNEAAIAPLAKLPVLRHLMLQRAVRLDDMDEAFLLDNPICRETATYEKIIQRLFVAVLCVDGRCFRDPPPTDVVASAMLELPLGDGLQTTLDIDDDIEERMLANAVAECSAACRRALSALE
ncbi:putative leucine-rich repeat protein (LRRP) [Trypanosoma grayi]|uniref:putative leucine-rich repeat protein (LRRP) n=1 Tax=Trypanosoma grayi TaxID=71804 RepID=UPI0004F4B1A2|nr:putative leucine-rich repeat protein (LRRP) [Trypanosoma grayi]KEG15237.1 putative leucine-rich repeat protein (LRRP) [Trypanosoma grayi]